MSDTPVEWRISDRPVPYPDALAFMEDRVAAIRAGTAPECVWLLEHPPLYTAGTVAPPLVSWASSGTPERRHSILNSGVRSIAF